MKSRRQKKLSAGIIISMMLSTNMQAQIIYTDIIPDQTITSTYNLDLNNDSIIDFVITHSTSSATGGCFGAKTNNYIKVTPTGSNNVVANTATNAIKMTFNSTIDSSILIWTSTSNQLLSGLTWACISLAPHTSPSWHSHPNGSWYNAVDGYLGLKLIKNGNTYYGWLRISTSGASSFTVKDYGYECTPNNFILAGATSDTLLSYINGGEADQNNFISVFPNPAFDKITVNISSHNFKNVDVQIIDLRGKVVFSNQYELKEGHTIVEIDISTLRKGIYILQIQNEEFLQTNKIIVVK